MQYLDVRGTPATYNHYPTGWAVAFSTPYQMFKRYSQFSGGTCDPMVIHWGLPLKALQSTLHGPIRAASVNCQQAGVALP